MGANGATKLRYHFERLSTGWQVNKNDKFIYCRKFDKTFYDMLQYHPI